MAALTSLTQLSSGNHVYENFYRQVDPGNTGRVGPTEAALFLKKSGLPDVTLGKIWDLADPEGKGFLDKQGFYVALRLVACAQSGQDVSLSSLNLTIPPPKFKDTSSPSLSTSSVSSEPHWAVRPEEKGKFDGIFESLAPVSGLLSGDKVKPVLINSKLPLDVLGKVWDLSDIDKDGHLDRDEFAVAMHLVYRALEKEPVPSVLPSSLIPPNKRKKSLVGSLPGMVPVLPASPPPPKDSLRSTPSHGSMNSLNSAGSLSPKHSLKSAQHSVNWVVPVTDKGRYDDIFLKTDLDLDGFVSGMEVKDIFMHSGLPQNLLAHIWALADTRQMGKLTREQFALAMHFIQQKVSKGMDPPQALTPDMIPPSERGTPVPSMSGYMTPVGSEMAALSEMRRDSSSSVGSGSEFTGIKELDDISQEIAQLQREKYTLEQDIRETEEAIRNKSSEVQEMQNDLDRETCSLQELEAQNQDAQERLEEMDQQKAKLEDMLNDVRIKCNEESQMISSLQNQIHSQETDLQSQEEELSRAKADLNQLQLEESQLEQSLTAGKFQLETIIKSLKATQDEINQARSKLSQIQDSQQEMTKSIEQYNNTLNGTHGGSMTNLADMSEGFHDRENGGFGAMEDPFKVKTSGFNSVPQEMHTDPFHSEDPFKTDPFKGDPFQSDPFAKQPSLPAAADLSLHPDPFGGDPFKETDPFKASSEDFFKKTTIKADPFSTPDPFSKSATLPTKTSHFTTNTDPFISISPKPTRGPGPGTCSGPGPGTCSGPGPDLFGTLDPFGSSTAFGGSNSSFGSNSGFADFSQMSKVRDPMEGRGGFPEYQQSGFVDDPFSRKQDGPALPPKKSIPPRPKPPSVKHTEERCKSTPVNMPGGAGDSAKPCDPFQPFGSDAIDPFQSKKGVGDPFSGKEPFAPSSSSKASKDSSLGFADFSSFGNEAQQLEWAKRESERAERERLKRLRQQEQEDLELAIALSKAEMSHG
ncbi:epidermal growth factor receptor substrate 15-like 1 isoform X7 [Coregonus clupeaformis]|uniref:epidermal growth factor receptor substrate 15-like 1 isoform X7 n=1 Tax=Coregonus clupeaformis TaxID=59861 RepID=UPI001BE06E6F|nr:epidermal growth factor receptor substrate 15-like 1 isoform X7 [Coregonus clupeaformis]